MQIPSDAGRGDLDFIFQMFEKKINESKTFLSLGGY